MERPGEAKTAGKADAPIWVWHPSPTILLGRVRPPRRPEWIPVTAYLPVRLTELSTRTDLSIAEADRLGGEFHFREVVARNTRRPPFFWRFSDRLVARAVLATEDEIHAGARHRNASAIARDDIKILAEACATPEIESIHRWDCAGHRKENR